MGTERETALRLIAHYSSKEKLGLCHCLKLPEDSPEFFGLAQRLAEKTEFDTEFVCCFLTAIKTGDRHFYEVQFPSMSRELALRMFRCFLEVRRHDSLVEIVEEISSGVPAEEFHRHEIINLVVVGATIIMRQELRARRFSQVN